MTLTNTAPTGLRSAGDKSRPITLVSFGYLHQPGERPPAADRVEDVRTRLRDPAAAREGGILDLDGRDPRVQQIVLATPGAAELLDNLAAYAELPAGPRSIAIGCAGGKHRACALTQLLGERLRERGHQVVIDHRHAHLPRVLAPAGDPTDDPVGDAADRLQRRAMRGYAECMVTVILLLIAALSGAPGPVVIVLAVLFVVALGRWIRVAPQRAASSRDGGDHDR
ncbi:RNase adapter RapZ [Nonomuraea sp. NPDC048882]|uniref:RapZ C-terminal domain-containing protein n=1 Tax=Nonomuraea sp. NPDC048882 TaxID=3154347 RepID=UPI00340B2E24